MRGRALSLSSHFVCGCLCAAAVAAATSSPSAAPVPPPPQISGDAVLAHLNRTIDWYHRVEALDASGANSQELLLRANVRDNAREVVRLGLQFARAQAALLESSAAATAAATRPIAGATTSRGRNIAQFAAAAQQRAAQLQEQIDEIDR